MNVQQGKGAWARPLTGREWTTNTKASHSRLVQNPSFSAFCP